MGRKTTTIRLKDETLDKLNDFMIEQQENGYTKIIKLEFIDYAISKVIDEIRNAKENNCAPTEDKNGMD